MWHTMHAKNSCNTCMNSAKCSLNQELSSGVHHAFVPPAPCPMPQGVPSSSFPPPQMAAQIQGVSIEERGLNKVV